ncbi:MAG: tetratricopeptide repeat protein [Acidobacteriota bacterium]
MKAKHSLLIAALVLIVLYVGDEQRWFRQVPASAQGPGPQVECEKLRHHGDPAATACYQRLSRSNDPLTKAEGLWGLRDYDGANLAFRAAVKLTPKDGSRRVRWGRMYLDHWQVGDAQDLFKEALDLNENDAQAMLGMALALSESFDGEAVKFAERALKADPTLAEAREVIARIRLEDNNPEKAVEEAKQALQISPEALQAMAILATVEMMDEKPATEWTDKIFKINPTYGEAYETMAHFFVINRRYDEGIALYRKALDVKPTLWSARAELGVNLMRFGKEDEARQNLEACYTNGYKPPLVVNSLTLLDSYKNFETYTTPTTILKVHKKEAALLRPYFQAELDRAVATYEKKYKFKLDGPVQVEVYPDHEDFAVRTMGMPGLGALGVTFGKVVAMDSPNGRKPGDFHWAATMWHELSHVYVLTMTDSRTPRWFTEGLAVYEETAISPDWGDRMTPREIKAIKEKALLPIADLDRGYIHPSYPEQVIVSYYQGGRVLTYIIEKWGFDAVLGMIQGFKEKKDTVQVIKEVLKVTPEEFDAQFFPWLEAQTKKTVDGFNDWTKQVKIVNENAKNKDWTAVITEGTAIRDIYPDYVEAGSVYEFLAQAYLAKEDKTNAIAQLEGYAAHGGRNPTTLKQLADLQAAAGNKRAAAAAIEKVNLIFPKDETAHQKLGGWYMDLGNPLAAIREFGAVLGSGTIDQAGAHYNLANALHAAKQNDKALEEVYLSLEAAPAYKPAQKLLLELSPQ